MHNKTHQTPQQTDPRAAVRPHKRSTQSHRFILLPLTSTALSEDRWKITPMLYRGVRGGRYRCTISCLALRKHGVMAARNCVGNKCITSVWERCLIISHHRPVYMAVCVCVYVPVHAPARVRAEPGREIEYLKGVKCRGYPSKEH